MENNCAATFMRFWMMNKKWSECEDIINGDVDMSVVHWKWSQKRVSGIFSDPINSTLIRCIQMSCRNINVLLVVPIRILYLSFYIAKRLSMVVKGTLVILSPHL